MMASITQDARIEQRAPSRVVAAAHTSNTSSHERCTFEQRAVIGVNAILAQAGTIMPCKAQVSVADAADSAFARGRASCVLSNQALTAAVSSNALFWHCRRRDGGKQSQARARHTAGTFSFSLQSRPLAGQTFQPKLFQASPVTVSACCRSCGTSLVAFFKLSPPCLPYLVQGSHIRFAAGFLFIDGFGILDDSINTCTLAFASYELLICAGGRVVGG